MQALPKERFCHYMNVKAAVFDFNGTLFFDYQENEDAWDLTCKEYRGYGLEKGEFSLFAGMTDTACARLIFPSGSNEKLVEIYTFKERIYKELCLKRKLQLAECSIKFIEELRKRGIKTAIASSAPVMNMEWYIPHFKLNEYFDIMLYGREDLPSKPCPDIYLLALKELGVDKSEAICFEDAVAGIKAALSAGFAKTYAIESPGIDLSATGKLAHLTNWESCLMNIDKVLSLEY